MPVISSLSVMIFQGWRDEIVRAILEMRRVLVLKKIVPPLNAKLPIAASPVGRNALVVDAPISVVKSSKPFVNSVDAIELSVSCQYEALLGTSRVTSTPLPICHL